MAATVEQLQGEVDELKSKVTQLSNLIALFMVNGLADAFDGTGNQTYGSGTMRLDGNGIQIVQNSSSDRPGLYYVPKFNTDPDGTAPYAVLQGYATDNAAVLDAAMMEIYANGDASAGTSARVRCETFIVGGGIAAIYSTVANQGTTASTILSTSRFDLDGVILGFEPVMTADPAGITEAAMWFRSDLDKFRVVANSITRNLTMDGTNTTLTIASGAVTATTAFHAIDTESAAASDDLDTISGGETGQVLYIHAANDARTVVAKDGTGNLKLAGDCTLDNSEDTLTVIYNGTNWLELARSNNGA